MATTSLKITYILAGDRNAPSEWRSIIAEVNDQALRGGRYDYAWATNRVKEHHGDPDCRPHVFDIDRVG